MPTSLVDLQRYWKKLEKPGVRFDADRAIELVVQRCERLEAVLECIADGQAGAEEARQALETV